MESEHPTTIPGLLAYWFDYARQDERPSPEVIDGFFGFLAACNLDIVTVNK